MNLQTLLKAKKGWVYRHTFEPEKSQAEADNMYKGLGIKPKRT